MFLHFDSLHLQNFIQFIHIHSQEQLSYDSLVHGQVFSKEWTSGKEQACHKEMQENVDTEDRSQPHGVGSGISSPRGDSFQRYPAGIQAHLTCYSIAGTEGASVRRHIFSVFNKWRKRKASNEVSEDVSRP